MNFFLLDGAQLGERLFESKTLALDYRTLYMGKSAEQIANVGPFLLSGERTFHQWFLEHGWGRSSGLVLNTEVDFESCLKHLRKFLIVKSEDGQELYFRFYDPRVLKIFLPTSRK